MSTVSMKTEKSELFIPIGSLKRKPKGERRSVSTFTWSRTNWGSQESKQADPLLSPKSPMESLKSPEVVKNDETVTSQNTEEVQNETGFRYVLINSKRSITICLQPNKQSK